MSGSALVPRLYYIIWIQSIAVYVDPYLRYPGSSLDKIFFLEGR